MASIAGTVTYRQRIALPAGSIVRVRLEDVSRADAPAVVLAESEIVTTGEQVPIPFLLDRGDAVLDPRGRHALRASIAVGGELRFATASHHPFETDGPTEGIELLVESAAARAPSLGDARWSLAELGGSSVEIGPGESLPFLDFDLEELRVPDPAAATASPEASTSRVASCGLARSRRRSWLSRARHAA